MSNPNHILKIEGMSCTNCALGIERHLQSKGLEAIKVNFSTKEVIFSSNKFKKNEIEDFIKSLGYKIIKDEKTEKFSIEEKLFLFCLIFTTPLFFHMFIESTLPVIYDFLHNPFVQFSLCLPVYITGTWFFGKSALGSIKNESLNMDVLITIGSSAAFIYSMYGWYLFYGTEEVSKFLFFETSATIITLVLLGNVLEKRSVKQTTTSIKELSKIKITKAKIERNNKIIEVDFEEIKTGDILLINSGDKIAVDGKILQGEASIDESMITGESIPVFKKNNDNVIGGTIIQSGNLKVIATKVGEDTVLSNIIHLVKNAQINKPRIQKIGDKISSIFVPIVLIISMSTFLISYYIYPEVTRLSDNTFIDSILRAIAVLVISCPCAMGLATPTAVMVGIGRAARNGILIKGGDTLEKLGSVKQVFFDKTGTITTGDFKIKNINIYSEDKIEEIKNIIYNLESHSSHPIALSLQKELSKFSRKMNLIDICEEKGIGISAKIEKDIYRLGSYRILENKKNKHDLYLTKNNNLIASIDIIDELKEGVPKVILNLKKHKIITTLISGDKREKCERISEKVSFNNIYAEQLPDQKLDKVKEITNKENTAMIGDGINDAPALSQSTVGISLGGASEIAIQSADVILLNKNNLSQLEKSILISKHTFLTIKQNLFWAFSYNIVAIPIAAMGFLNPMWGALFMAFSDVVVIGNSIRLKYKKLN